MRVFSSVKLILQQILFLEFPRCELIIAMKVYKHDYNLTQLKITWDIFPSCKLVLSTLLKI